MNERIEHLLDQFDWEAVRKTMIALNWTWETPELPPSYNEMRKLARRLLEEAQEADPPSIRDEDGFMAEFYPNVLRLSFVVTMTEDLAEEIDG